MSPHTSKLVDFHHFHPKLVDKNQSHQLIYEQKLEFRGLVAELNFT